MSTGSGAIHWVLARLQEGYPTVLFESLLSEAEEHAVQRALYADAFRLRHLKTRLLNSLSYQLSGADSARLKACTWTLAPDAGVVEEAVASRHEMSTVDVAALSLAMEARGDSLTALKCADEALRSYRGESRFASLHRDYEGRARLLYLVKAFSTLGVIGTSPGKAVDVVSNSWPPIPIKFLATLVEKSNLRSLVNIATALPNGDPKQMVCDALVRASATAEADLTAWNEFPILCCGALIGSLAAMHAKEVEVWLNPFEVDWLDGSYEERQDVLAKLAHDWIFGAIRLALTVRGESYSLVKAPKFKDRENVSDYLNHLGDVGRGIALRWAAREIVSFAYIYEAFDSIDFPGYRNFQRGQGASDFRRCLHAIAIDLHLLNATLGNTPLVGAEEVQRAMMFIWFDADEFRKQYVSRAVKVLSDDAAEVFIRAQLQALDRSVNEETGVRMMACLELCEMALRHRLAKTAAELCRRTWELVLGYGQRKDPALSDVMDALEYLVPVAPDDTRRLLADIAPQVHNVLSYTDGKGTRHVLAHADKILAKLHRSALAEKHREHTEAGEWYHAEKSLEAFITTADADSPALRALMRTGLHADAVNALKKAEEKGNSNVERMLAEAEFHVGTDVGQIQEARAGNSTTDWKPFAGDVKTYPVADLPRLLSDLTGYYGVRGDTLREWYAYWEAQGHGSELIAALEPRFFSGGGLDHDLDELLDLAFATKLKLEGKAAAFPYIVKAQLYRGGWVGPAYMERREVTEARLRLVVKTYPKRCDEFFLKSAISRYSEPKQTRIIPSDLMVFFLSLQGRTAEAVQMAEAMVRSVQEDTRTLHLEQPEWAKRLARPEGDVP